MRRCKRSGVVVHMAKKKAGGKKKKAKKKFGAADSSAVAVHYPFDGEGSAVVDGGEAVSNPADAPVPPPAQFPGGSGGPADVIPASTDAEAAAAAAAALAAAAEDAAAWMGAPRLEDTDYTKVGSRQGAPPACLPACLPARLLLCFPPSSFTTAPRETQDCSVPSSRRAAALIAELRRYDADIAARRAANEPGLDPVKCAKERRRIEVAAQVGHMRGCCLLLWRRPAPLRHCAVTAVTFPAWCFPTLMLAGLPSRMFRPRSPHLTLASSSTATIFGGGFLRSTIFGARLRSVRRAQRRCRRRRRWRGGAAIQGDVRMRSVRVRMQRWRRRGAQRASSVAPSDLPLAGAHTWPLGRTLCAWMGCACYGTGRSRT